MKRKNTKKILALVLAFTIIAQFTNVLAVVPPIRQNNVIINSNVLPAWIPNKNITETPLKNQKYNKSSILLNDDSYQNHVQPLPQTSVMSTLPDSVDLSANGNFPPAENQGAQGSCVAWATGYALKSYQESIESGISPTTPSRQYSPAYLYNQYSPQSDNGMSIANALNTIVNQGICTLEDMPYNQYDYYTQPNDFQKKQASRKKAWRYSTAETHIDTIHVDSCNELSTPHDHYLEFVNDYNWVRNKLANGQPVVIGFYTNDNPLAIHEPGGHAVCIVGYNDELQMFKYLNSSGIGWGDNGYGYMGYDKYLSVAGHAYTLDDLQYDETQPVRIVNPSTNYYLNTWQNSSIGNFEIGVSTDLNTTGQYFQFKNAKISKSYGDSLLNGYYLESILAGNYFLEDNTDFIGIFKGDQNSSQRVYLEPTTYNNTYRINLNNKYLTLQGTSLTTTSLDANNTGQLWRFESYTQPDGVTTSMTKAIKNSGNNGYLTTYGIFPNTKVKTNTTLNKKNQIWNINYSSNINAYKFTNNYFNQFNDYKGVTTMVLKDKKVYADDESIVNDPYSKHYWIFKNNNGTYKIINMISYASIDTNIGDSSYLLNTNLNNNTSFQNWQFETPPTNPDSSINLDYASPIRLLSTHMSMHASLYMNVDYNNSSYSGGIESDNTTDEYFKIIQNQDDGTYTFASLLNEKIVLEDNTAFVGTIPRGTQPTKATQRWYIEQDDDGCFSLRNKSTGRYLCCSYSGTLELSTTPSAYSSDTWRFIEYTKPTFLDNNFRTKIKVGYMPNNGSLYMSYLSNPTNPATHDRVYVENSNNSRYEIWQVLYSPEESAYKIVKDYYEGSELNANNYIGKYSLDQTTDNKIKINPISDGYSRNIRIFENTDGSYMFVNASNNTACGVNTTGSECYVEPKALNGIDSSQKWYFEYEPTFSINKVTSTQCINVSQSAIIGGTSTFSVGLNPYNDTITQYFHIIQNQDDGTYSLRSILSNYQYLSDSANFISSITQTTSNNQRWYIEQTSDPFTYKLKNKSTGQYLNTSGNNFVMTGNLRSAVWKIDGFTP